MALRFRRGSESDRTNPSFVPEDGEPVWIVDTKRLYIGDGSTSGGILVTGAGGGGSTPGINDNTTGVVLTLDNAISTFTNDVELDGSDLILAGGSITGTGNINILGNITASGTLTGNIANIGSVNVTAGINAGAVVQAPFFDGDLTGSVFSDNSTLVVDGLTGNVFAQTLETNLIVVNDAFGSAITINLANNNLQLSPPDINDTNSKNLRIISNENSSVLKLTRSSTSDISAADLTYGSILFERSDITDSVSTGLILGRRDAIFIGSDPSGLFPAELFVSITNGNFGIGTLDPLANLDVNGNAIVSGNLEAAAFEFVGSNITTSDSSIITVTPAVTFNSDVVVENSLTVANTLTVDTLAVTNFQTSGAGTPELSSDTDILLTAGNEIVMTASDVKSKADVQVEGSVMLGKPASNNPDIFVPAVVNAAILSGISTASTVDGANYVKEVFRQRLDRNTSGGELLLALNDINNATPANRHLIAKYLWHNNGTNTYTVASLGTSGNAALLASVAVTLDDAGGNFDLVVTVRMPTAQLSGATALVTGQLAITSNPLTASVSGI